MKQLQRTIKHVGLGTLVWLMATSLVWAAPRKGAHTNKPVTKQQINKQANKRTKRWLAQNNTNTPSTSTSTSKKSNFVPGAAWTLESVSAIVATGGFILTAIGATILGRRDQIYDEFRNPPGFGGAPPTPEAKTLVEMQDQGNAFLISGLIVAGVGVVGMLVGGVWIVAHNTEQNNKSNTSTASLPPTTHNKRMTLLRTQ